MESSNKESSFIDFYEIQKELILPSKTHFRLYMSEIYECLLSDEKENQEISFFEFRHYLKLSLPISKRIFRVFKNENLDAPIDSLTLSKEKFVENFVKIYFGTYEELVEFVFKLFDFKNKNSLLRNNVKYLMIYLPLLKKNEKNQKDYIECIDNILNLLFKDKTSSVSLKEFLNFIDTQNSEIFLSIIGYIYKYKPFSFNSLNFIKSKNITKIDNPLKKNHVKSKSIIMSDESNNINNNGNVKMIEIKKNISKFLEYEEFFTHQTSEEDGNNLDIKNNKSNENLKKKKSEEYFDEDEFDNLDINRKKSMNLISPDKKKDNLNLKKGTISFNLQNPINKMSNFDSPLKKYQPNVKTQKSNSIIKLMTNDDMGNEKIDYVESGIYIIQGNEFQSNNPKFTKQHALFIDDDIFIFKDSKLDCLMKIYNLKSCQISELDIKSWGKIPYYYIGIRFVYNKESKNHYNFFILFTSKENATQAINIIHKNLNYKKISDIYEIKSTLGEGSFGTVYKAKNKKTGEIVAIKSIQKSKMKYNHNNLLQNEIDIMKLICHSQVVNFKESFEDETNVNIVMDFIPGMDLFAFLDQKITFSEKFVKFVVQNLVEILSYLHSYGIIHRDFKLDNIMINTSENLISKEVKIKGSREEKKSSKSLLNLTDMSKYKPFYENPSNVQIKLTDFGISTILEVDEKVNDDIGTLRFSAPEILTKTPYNKNVDVWSLGICAYLMYSGEFPFEESDNDLTRKMILYDNLKFNNEIWNSASENFKDFIRLCLEKDSNKRISILKISKHSFLAE